MQLNELNQVKSHRVSVKLELAITFRLRHPEKSLEEYDRDELMELINEALDDYIHLDHAECLDFEECEITESVGGVERQTRIV